MFIDVSVKRGCFGRDCGALEPDLFLSVVENVRDYAIIRLKLNGEIASWNTGATQMSGYKPAEILGQHFSKLYTTEDICNKRPERELQTAAAEGRAEDEGWRVRKDGSKVYVNAIITALKGSDGEVAGFVKITRDLTESRNAAEKMRIYSEELARSNEELEHFAYVASHDLQEPLRTVSSFSQLLAARYKGKLDPDADEFIHFIVDGVLRMQTLINDLLVYSRIGKGGQISSKVDCEQILETAVQNLEVAVRQSSGTVTHDPLPTVRADEGQMTQLFQNLLGNSVKYRRPGVPVQIHVSAVRQESGWLFSIRDNGIGIDPKYFDRIFIIFQRLHGRDEFQGSGIGLAICKKIVERQGGRIWLESRPGKETIFYFTLPDVKGAL